MGTNLDTSMFDGIESEQLGIDRNPKLGAGEYVVELLKTFVHVSTNPKTKNLKYGMVEVKVLEATEGALSPVGATATISLSNNSPAFLKDTKNLMLAAAGIAGEVERAKAAKELDAEKAAAFFSSDEKVQSKFVKGRKIKVRITPAISAAGNAYTKKSFSPVVN